MARLLGRSPGNLATVLLVRTMSDADYPVIQEVYTQLKDQALTDDFLPDLKSQMQSSWSTTRVVVAQLLGKIRTGAANRFVHLRQAVVRLVSKQEGDLATVLLIRQLSDEEYAVRSSVNTFLMSRPLYDDLAKELFDAYSSRYDMIRMWVVKLSGRIKSSKVQAFLIYKLDQEIDYQVKQEIKRQLSMQ